MLMISFIPLFIVPNMENDNWNGEREVRSCQTENILITAYLGLPPPRTLNNPRSVRLSGQYSKPCHLMQLLPLLPQKHSYFSFYF
jgi:hypothetical protein